VGSNELTDDVNTEYEPDDCCAKRSTDDHSTHSCSVVRPNGSTYTYTDGCT
jgi:hypothetical protein